MTEPGRAWFRLLYQMKIAAPTMARLSKTMPTMSPLFGVGPLLAFKVASAEVAVLESAELSVVLLMDLEVEVMVNTPETIFGMAVAAFVVESSVIDVGSEK